MDPYEATNVLMAKIRTLDPENASKIMGYILIQDFAERDMLRLAYGPETLLQNLILDAKIKLGLFSSMLSTSTPAASTTTNPSSPSPLQQQQAAAMLGRLPVAAASDPFSQPSPRGSSLVSSISPRSSPFLSYDNIRNGSAIVSPFSKNADSTVAHMGPPPGAGGGGGGGGDFLDEYQLSDYLSFLDDSSKSDEFGGEAGAVDLGGGFPAANGDAHFHRRRFSESDVCFDAEDGGFGNGFRPCMYFSKGFCKNGDNCKFNHGGGGFDSDHLVEINGGASGGFMVGSPRELEGLYLQHQQQQQEAMMRMKVLQHQHQQRLAYTKYMNFLLQQRKESQRLGAAAMMADEFHKFGRFGPERNDFFTMGMAEKANSASRQIYLTFPADSTFKDEDVSNYFSTFGPVEDVRIPYQQKRMFGFVTFVHPETVKHILARGNPHFICDSRVLVKPYKEKGKILNNRREQLLPHHHLERGNFSPGSSPSGLDPRELYDAQLGAKMMYNTQDMMLRRKLEEQAELQQAIELQERRLINLQLPVVRGDYVQRHQRSFSVGSPVSLSPPLNQTAMLNGKNEEVLEDNGNCSGATLSAAVAVDEQNLEHDVNKSFMENNGTLNEKEESSNSEDCNVHQCHESDAEDGLPHSLFTSAVEPSGNQLLDHSSCLAVVKENAEFSVSSESDSSVSSSSSD